jgi:hypothetical protein
MNKTKMAEFRAWVSRKRKDFRYEYNMFASHWPVPLFVFFAIVIAGIGVLIVNAVSTTREVHAVAVRSGLMVRRDTSVYVNTNGSGVIEDTARVVRSHYVYMRGPNLDRIISINVPALVRADVAFAVARFDSVITTPDSIYVVSWYGSGMYRPIQNKMRWVRTY